MGVAGWGGGEVVGGKEGERRKLYGPGLCCALAPASSKVGCKPFKQQDQDHRFSPAKSLCGLHAVSWSLAFTLGAAGCDRAVLKLCLQRSTCHLYGHPK